jgi:hypothetical protein
VGVAAVFLLLSHLVVELAGWRLHQPAADESLRVVEAFRQRGERVDVALLGSSRVRRGFSVAALEKELTRRTGREIRAFNFGLQAGTVPAFHIVARDLLRDDLAPRLVLVGLGVRSLNDSSPRYVRTLRHLASPRDLLGPLGPRLTRPAELGAGLLALFRAPGTLLQTWRLGGEPASDIAELLARGGFYYGDGAEAAIDSRELARRTELRARRAREVLLADFDPDGRPRRALALLLATMAERGIAVLVVSLPVTDAFAGAAYTHGEHRRYLSTVRQVCDEAGVRFIDANSAAYRPPSEMYFDGDHLNAAGAAAFSRAFAAELAPLLD